MLCKAEKKAELEDQNNGAEVGRARPGNKDVGTF